VFSNPQVIKRIQSDFIPVALKAALVNNPGDDIEGRLYREIGRSKLAPQGICIANSDGKALEWALTFDNDASVLAFLDRAVQRYHDLPDARGPVNSERFMRFPTQRMPDAADSGEAPPEADAHPQGTNCPATPGFPRGTLIARVIGRALDASGKPLADTTRQENYIEDRFEVPPDVQEAAAGALRAAGAAPVALPRPLSRLCMTYAYLGQLDVRLIDNPVGAPENVAQSNFQAQRISEGNGLTLMRIEGKSDVTTETNRRMGMTFRHRVKLSWQGYIELNGRRITQLILSARGTERLVWGEDHDLARSANPNNAVAFLPAGKPLDLAREVRFGILGSPVTLDETTAGP
jgi:hypothetical protein